MATATIRNCGAGDYASIVDIYNHYIETSHVTFDTRPFTVGERVRWFSQFADDGPYQVLVAELDGRVAGYCASTQFRSKPAYDVSVETTVYISSESTGAGIGKALYGELLPRLRRNGVHGAFAGIALPNDASIRLHTELGFSPVGTYREVGRKFGRYVDVSWYQKILEEN